MVPSDECEQSSAAGRAEDFDQLLSAARAGSRDAVGALVQRYRPYLLMIANCEWDSELRGKLGASDLVQESLLTAQHSLGEFRGHCEDDLRAWLRGILAKDILEARRRFKGTAKRQANREVPLPGELHGDLDTPGTEAASQEEAEALQAAMDRLPEDYRQVLQLRNWQQLTFAEIGEKLDRSAEGARKLWTRAVIQLQRELQTHAGQDERPDVAG